ncbi:MAG: DNA repair protein RecN [Bacteroidales bacterium]|nr:DNA repair protein RecN [Bacteroidales bacterium]MDD6960291.1 DNA repair protein RecN [Bacteroidales bacterium]MDY6186583.1 DNA repair protein RecN [Muribaculaceae bacterium]
MIGHLHISNYALISSLDLNFGPGMNIITGETGAGKSIILGALGLVMGMRSDSKAVRTGATKAVIEVEFDITGLVEVSTWLDKNIEDNPSGVCIMRREISAKGNSRAFINDTPTTLDQMQTLSSMLLDVHTQHQNLSLSDNRYQLSVIDSVAGTNNVLKQYQEAYHTYRQALDEYARVRDTAERYRADEEYIAYQLEQINELGLVPHEQEDLERERDRAANATTTREHLEATNNSLNTGDGGITAALTTAIEHLGQLQENYDDASDLASRLMGVRTEINDIADTVADHLAAMTVDTMPLEEIEDRLSKIYSLETRHNVETSDMLIERAKQLQERIDIIHDSNGTLAHLENNAKQAKKQAVIIARQLTKMRTESALKFGETLVELARPLGLSNLRCDILISKSKLTPLGMDQIDFRFAFNKNQPLMSVGKTASGGEISRLILAIKAIVSEYANMPTLIFDEVDTGVSGEIATRMGRMMEKISRHTQIIVITHLPQVASQPGRHFCVYKEDDETSTNTNVKQLTEKERIDEIAKMLGAGAGDNAAHNNAVSLIESNKTA